MSDSKTQIHEILQDQAAFFSSGATRSLSYRREALQRLMAFIKKNEDIFVSALDQDLKKPKFESIGSELLPVYQEIQNALNCLSEWCEPRPCPAPLFSYTHMGTRSYLLPEPLGLCLIISPWNYPFYLSLPPLVSAIAAGNCVVLKPSELAPATSKILESCLGAVFDSRHVYCATGGIETSQNLLKERFDKIFFTGSSRVGKEVLKAAAPHLCPVTLELGGKSPCVLDESAFQTSSLKKILWAKFYNAGQTCVAPDYLLLPKALEDRFLTEAESLLKSFYGEDALNSKDFASLINADHFNRIRSLVKESSVRLGGKGDPKRNRIEPTVVAVSHSEEAVMQDEIFGPVLPVVTYEHFDEVYDWILSYEKALVIYLFSRSRKQQREFSQRTSSGTLVINDALIHMSHPHLPFGGVGHSGMGKSHGRFGFDEFSHQKAVEEKHWGPDQLRYPPYKKQWSALLRRFF